MRVCPWGAGDGSGGGRLCLGSGDGSGGGRLAWGAGDGSWWVHACAWGLVMVLGVCACAWGLAMVPGGWVPVLGWLVMVPGGEVHGADGSIGDIWPDSFICD